MTRKSFKLKSVLLVLVLMVLAVSGVLRLRTPSLPAAIHDPALTVILVTFDGVRPQELLSGGDPLQASAPDIKTAMPYMMEDLVPRGVFLGDRSLGSRFSLGSPMGITAFCGLTGVSQQLEHINGGGAAPASEDDAVMELALKTFAGPLPKLLYIGLGESDTAGHSRARAICG